MGGTMEYDRMRNRNGMGLNYRKPLDDTDPYIRGDELPAGVDPSKALLIGELNRMERDMLGLSSFGDYSIEQCRRATGLSKNTILKVLRWHLNWPEPACDDCGEPNTANPRCSKHRGWS